MPKPSLPSQREIFGVLLPVLVERGWESSDGGGAEVVTTAARPWHSLDTGGGTVTLHTAVTLLSHCFHTLISKVMW